jgi:lipopolysaccharide export system protein LptC
VLFSLKRTLTLLLPVAAAVAALAATTQISPDKPVVNFRLPNFTPDGYRSWLVRGSEGYYLAKENQIDVKDLTLSIFSGMSDDKLMTMILSPSAKVLPNESIVTGESTIRVINDDFEATGTGWRYEHKDKKIIIRKKVRVTFRAEFKDILK